ncbi:MAG: PTS sugar transporter subunit IIC/EAL domain-containing protein, partial [Lachnospiraceae bacterium]|nr:PTS sugar transporter subunit IIC/EAL domain-containing protein [Lachnospiraceae bacterium]
MGLGKKIENFFIRNSCRVEKSHILNEIVQSFVALIPVFMIGAFCLVFQNFPVDSVREWIANAYNGMIYHTLELIYDATYGMAAVYVLIVLSFKYSISLTKGFSALNVINTITVVASYFILIAGDVINITGAQLIRNPYDDKKIFLQDYTSAENIFLALIVTIVATQITLRISGAISKKKDNLVLKTDFLYSVKCLLPMVATMGVFAIMASVIKAVTGYNHIGDLLVSVLNKPFEIMGQNLFSGLLLIFVENVSWFFGLHGANTFKNLTTIVFPDGSGSIFTKTFLDVYTTFSGSGLTIGLIIASLLVVRNREEKKLIGLSFIPGIFNINEMVIFGIPVVLNLPIIIPFVLVPMVSFAIAYGATVAGIVPMVTTTVEWTVPPIISGYMATGSLMVDVLQVIIIVISILIYLPFVKLYEKVKASLYEEKIAQLTEMYKEAEKQNKQMRFSTLPNKYIMVVAKIGEKLKYDIKHEQVTIHYQPQHDKDGRVVSSEALLRWKGDTEKVIYPPLVVAIAKEFRIYDVMTEIIVEEALTDVVRIHEEVGEYLTVSVNIDVEQLLNKAFINWVIGRVKYYGIPEGTLGLEITEQQNLVGASNLSEILDKFREHGI